jgi:hypothetical protein
VDLLPAAFKASLDAVIAGSVRQDRCVIRRHLRSDEPGMP